jgi:protocatechuate 3,4-dioxygenase beta subunit
VVLGRFHFSGKCLYQAVALVRKVYSGIKLKESEYGCAKDTCPKTGGLVWRWIGTAVAYLTVASAVAFGVNLVTLTGKVTDVTGKPIVHATVMVYHAGVKNGYSTLCPSCYADCGNRTVTDAAGTYTFMNLSPNSREKPIKSRYRTSYCRAGRLLWHALGSAGLE